MVLENNAAKPVAITMGDPAGVGPEVIMAALSALSAQEREGIVVVGSRAVLERAGKVVGSSLTVGLRGQAGNRGVVVEEVVVPNLVAEFGQLDPSCGEAAFRYIERAVRLTEAGEMAGLVTAPINKEALNKAGHKYDGHTGMLASLTGSRASFMLLASPKLKAIHVSTHVSLRDAIGRATTERVLATIEAGNDHLKRIGYARPRIAVAGINPHCGENGLFGTEDVDFIAPAVEQARAKGIEVFGPISADTVYHRAYNGAFDLVVAQYHDQGHIPMKLVAFDTTVNVSLGLPIDRTSVDHGTAFDIAGTGKANHENMLEAIAYGRRLALSRA